MKVNEKSFLLSILFTGLFFNTVTFAKAVSPQELLPDSINEKTMDGVTVRKGTIGAFILNLKKLEEIFTNNPQSNEISSYKTSLREAIPALNALKVFDLVTIDNLLNARHDDGKIYQAKVLMAAFYLQQFPQGVTDFRIKAIENLKPYVLETVRDELNVVLQFKNKK